MISLFSAVCRCEKAAAEKGFEYISLRYFGVCHGLKQLPKEKSDFCVHHSFEQCMKSHDRCVGADDAEYVYRVTLKLQTSNPGRKSNFLFWTLMKMTFYLVSFIWVIFQYAKYFRFLGNRKLTVPTKS